MLEIAAFAFISLFGALSPGPDFAIVTRHALTGSRKAALYATLGIASALVIHVSYASLGASFLYAQSQFFFRIMQGGGSLYLTYLGWQLLKKHKKPSFTFIETPKKAYLSGFLTNLLNPKATLFILSLFSQFVKPHTPPIVILVYCFLISGTALLWFSSLSIFITAPRFQPIFKQLQPLLMKCMGIILWLLALTSFASLFLTSA